MQRETTNQLTNYFCHIVVVLINYIQNLENIYSSPIPTNLW